MGGGQLQLLEVGELDLEGEGLDYFFIMELLAGAVDSVENCWEHLPAKDQGEDQQDGEGEEGVRQVYWGEVEQFQTCLLSLYAFSQVSGNTFLEYLNINW